MNGGDAELGELPQGHARLTQALLEGPRRDGRAHESQRGVGDAAGRAAAGALESRHGSRAGESRPLEGDAVGEPRALVPAIEEHGRAAAHRVDDRAIGRKAPAWRRRAAAAGAARRPVLVRAPVAAGQPGALAHARHRLLDACGEGRGRAHVEEVGADEQGARLVEVRVVVDETGCHESAAGVDHPCVRAAVARDLGVSADRCEPLAPHGERAGPRASGVRGPDARVAEDDVGVLRVERMEARQAREEQQGERLHEHLEAWSSGQRACRT